jgi:hypothetical protein
MTFMGLGQLCAGPIPVHALAEHALARQAIRDLMQISRRTPVDLQELAQRTSAA